MCIVNSKNLEVGFVYFLVDNNASSFKIGSSLNVAQRIRAFSGEFNFSKSFQLVCPKVLVTKIEKLLHYFFRAFHFDMPHADGYTEWFSMNCFDQVKEFIHNYKSHIGWIELDVIDYGRLDLSLNKPPLSLNWHERRENLALSRKKKAYDNNKIAYEKLCYWLNWLKEEQILLGKFREKQIDYLLINSEKKEKKDIFSKDFFADFHLYNHAMSGSWLIFSSISYNHSLASAEIHFSEKRPVADIPYGEETIKLLDSIHETTNNT